MNLEMRLLRAERSTRLLGTQLVGASVILLLLATMTAGRAEKRSPPTTQAADSYHISTLVADTVVVNKEAAVLHKHGIEMESLCEIRPDASGNGSVAAFKRQHEESLTLQGGWDDDHKVFSGGQLSLNNIGANGWWTITNGDDGKVKHFNVKHRRIDFEKP